MSEHISLETAIAMHQQGMLDQAEAIYKQILHTQPQNFDAIQLLATVALQRNNFASAIDLFDRALKINSNFADAHNNRGTSLKNLDRYAEALDSFDRALKIKPNFAEAHFNRGNTLYSLKRYEEALDSYDRAIKIKPDYVDALQNRGNVLLDLNHYQKAMESYDCALKIAKYPPKKTTLKHIDVKSNSYDMHSIVLALESCSRGGNIYWANEYFFRWLSAEEATEEKSNICLEQKDIIILAENIVFNIRQGDTLLSTKLDFLNQLVINGKFPAAAVSLARYYSKIGDYSQALEIAKSAKTTLSHGFHIIQNQITAIERQIEGKPIQAALRRYLGNDEGYLLDRTCETFFERLDIHENGNAAVCCGHWMPGYSLGNVITQGLSASQVFNSDMAISGRKSVIDGSFQYCDLVKCPVISGDRLHTKNAVIGENSKRAINNNQLIFDSPSYVVLALDKSCNLSCPSCRTSVISENGELQSLKTKIIDESIAPLLKTTKILNLNAAGELMTSRPLRKLLTKLNRQDYPELQLKIITNGTLFTKKEWEKFPNIHNMVDEIRISTDAACKETFEKLRRGASWEQFIENIHFLAELRKESIINSLMFSMTYQVDNFREMPAFVDMCHDLDPESYVLFEKLEQWGALTSEEYIAKAVHHATHPFYKEFIEIAKQLKLRQDNILILSDYNGLI